jgi:hypothetical protein
VANSAHGGHGARNAPAPALTTYSGLILVMAQAPHNDPGLILVRDILSVITLVMAPRNDPGLD